MLVTLIQFARIPELIAKLGWEVVVTQLLKVVVFVCALLLNLGSSHAGLYLPQDISFMSERKSSLCGVRADYLLSGAILRVEVLASQTNAAVGVVARVYQPNAAGPLLRDIWLKTASLFSLGRFQPALANSNGILESRGELNPEGGKKFLRELTRGEVEVSVIFDGVMPMARLPVGLPSPLPLSVRDELKRCLRSRDR